MPRALIDTTILYAAAYREDGDHTKALPILHGIDTAALPEGIILDYVLAETLNGLTAKAGHDAAVDFLRRLEENSHFHIASLTAHEFTAAKSLFRKYEGFSFVDACIVAYMEVEGFSYLYSFDSDFDAAGDIYRLDMPTNPYQAE